MGTAYVGRFAPSPTGKLHTGSLYTALASYLDAKANQGQWLVRIDDADTVRSHSQISKDILTTLQRHGMVSDQPVLYQSLRSARYQSVLQGLQEQGLCFYCTCSRASLKGINGYPGTCRQNKWLAAPDRSIKIKASAHDFEPFTDRLRGLIEPPVLSEGVYNDFILKRRDGLFSYQFSCVVDDIDQSVTDIVRGSDIMDSTFKQRFLYSALNHDTPNYLHLPIITDKAGKKLSKQNLALPVRDDQAPRNLIKALFALKQKLPPVEFHQSVNKILAFAINNWQTQLIPSKGQITE